MLRLLTLCAALVLGQAALAQPAAGVPQVPVLVIEFDRLISDSRPGRRILAELDAQRDALVSENERIEQELTDEERRLTEQRAQLPAEEFRALAEAFDTKVTAIRTAQDEKARVLTTSAEQRQQRFLEAVRPILAQIMVEAGADVMIERGTTILVDDNVIITDLAIQRIDAALGQPDE
ncbi:OmpH family outer membrane protein [Pseudaestuariivita atlantica]|uniref:Outer membrane chaperone Skp n=1 Tax=Pseudaestuariivita atlantica TaxID=1317121 RepID=A0A0L1JMS8_9RHOB|nr:OmpH family outer membrane protein [Pseudaestuariivita atlantica]KNG93012.1 hypothetical protein ATO11_13890 [Pseudaestuariivita atlantica]